MAGRPTSYNEEIQRLSDEYANMFYGEAYRELLNKEVKDTVVPSVEGLSHYINIARSTLYLWMQDEEKVAFSDTISKIDARQKELLINMGLAGKFNAQIGKLMLGNHGISEKTVTDIGNKEGESFKTDSSINFIPVGAKD